MNEFHYPIVHVCPLYPTQYKINGTQSNAKIRRERDKKKNQQIVKCSNQNTLREKEKMEKHKKNHHSIHHNST